MINHGGHFKKDVSAEAIKAYEEISKKTSDKFETEKYVHEHVKDLYPGLLRVHFQDTPLPSLLPGHIAWASYKIGPHHLILVEYEPSQHQEVPVICVPKEQHDQGDHKPQKDGHHHGHQDHHDNKAHKAEDKQQHKFGGSSLKKDVTNEAVAAFNEIYKKNHDKFDIEDYVHEKLNPIYPGHLRVHWQDGAMPSCKVGFMGWVSIPVTDGYLCLVEYPNED